MSWFRKEHEPLPAQEQESRVPGGLYVKCNGCKETIYRKEVVSNQAVCPRCAFHFRISARERLSLLCDSLWEEFDQNLASSDPLKFKDTKNYADRLVDSKAKTDSYDALISAVGTMGGLSTVMAVMEYGFIGGSMGVVVGASVPMFLGAMIMGPSAAWLLKQFDKLTADRLKAGFEMLVDNFSLGIIGGAMALLGDWAVGPIVNNVTKGAGNGVNWLVNHHMLPFASVLIEPAKVLFLNNAINHGVLDPLGVAQSAAHGKSILFMLESNPGPGLGILVAYFLFGPRRLRPTVPGAIIIHFLGGIHEIYFPYILMKPRLILAAIAGGFAGISVFSITKAGLVASPSPGSIFAYAAETPRGGYAGVFLGVLVAAAVSFAVASVLLGFGRGEKKETEDAAGDGTAVQAEAVAA